MRIYIASAITHAPPKVRGIVSGLNDLLKALGHDVVAPALGEIGGDPFQADMEAIESSDLLVALIDYPSTGMGYEIATAQRLGIEVIPVRTEDWLDPTIESNGWVCFPKRKNLFLESALKA